MSIVCFFSTCCLDKGWGYEWAVMSVKQNKECICDIRSSKGNHSSITNMYVGSHQARIDRCGVGAGFV